MLWGFLAGVLVTLGLFAFLVLQAPKKTPMLTMVARDYAWPYRPNTWAQEDLNRLQSLNGRSLEVLNVGQDSMRRSEWIAEFGRKLTQVSYSHERTQPVLVYISMHGSVDGDGVPCLLPPNSSPVDSASWIPIPLLLEEIKQFQSGSKRPVVMFLDCNRTLANWDRGLIFNSFSDALTKAVSKADLPNVFAFNSTSAGEHAETSENLRGSIFGRSVALALSGKADESSVGGNVDRRVQLSELVHYVRNQVQEWTLASRGREQSPQIEPEQGNDLTLCWSISGQELDSGPEVSSERVNRAVDDLFELWEDFEDLPHASVQRLLPVESMRWMQDLTWCEQAILGGSFYLPRVETQLRQLRTSLQSIQDQISTTNSQAGDYWRDKAGPAGHTLRLHAYFGHEDSNSQACQQTLDDLIASYSPSALAATLQSAPPVWNRYADFRFLTILNQMQPDGVTTRRDLMTTALSTQRACRDAPATRDLRLTSRVSEACGELDRLRRNLEDQLLTGQGSVADWQGLQKQVTQVETYLNALARYYELCDSAQRDLPLLARWLADPNFGGDIFRKHIEMSDSVLSDAFDTHRSLASFLGMPTTGGLQGDQERLHSAAQSLTDAMTKLQNAFASEAVLSNSEAAWRIDDLDKNQALQRVPLLFPPNKQNRMSGAAQRKLLFQVTRRMLLHFERTGNTRMANRSDTRGMQDPEATQFDSLRSILNTTRNLVRALIGSVEQDKQFAQLADSELSIARLESLIRTTLEAFPERNRAVLEEARVRGKNSRELLFQAAQRSRQLASYWRPNKETGAIAALRKFDGNLFVMVQLESVLNDFLGGANEIDPPFYQYSGESYLQYFQDAGLVDVELTLSSRTQSQLLTDLINAEQHGLTLQAERNFAVDGQILGPFRITLQQGEVTAFSNLPPLIGQLVVSSTQERLAKPMPLQLSGPTVGKTLPHQFQVPSTAESKTMTDGQAHAAFQFRGHEVMTGLSLSVPNGQNIAIEAPTATSAQVTVVDSQTKPVSVMLVLDCSQSMNQTIPWEASQQDLTKFDAAITATNQILNALARLPNARVGLVLYGHRVGWNTASPSQILRQTDYANPIPDGLMPYADTEIVLPFGRFARAERDAIQKLLKTVKPWGETPLYLSIRNALNEMNSKSLGGKQQIIVITDGVNRQLNPSADAYVSLSSLLSENFGQTSVNILGFGIDPNESQAAARQFEQLAQRTGGEYVEINDAGRLLRKVDDYFAERRFDVKTAAGTQTQPLGSPISISLTPGQRQPAQVSFEGFRSQVMLEPGESYQLIVDESSRQLSSAQYLIRSPVFSRMGNSQGPGHVQVGVHRPRLTQQKLTMEISFQHVDKQPLSRPFAYAVRLRPLANEQVLSDREYRIASNRFKSNTPVPVATLTAEDWPENATSVEVTCAAIFDEQFMPPQPIPLNQLDNEDSIGLIEWQLPTEQPDTLLLVRKQGTTALLLPEATNVEQCQSEIDLVNGLIIDRWKFFDPLSKSRLNSLSFLSVTPSQSPWLDNSAAPVTVPIDSEDALTPQAGPILVR